MRRILNVKIAYFLIIGSFLLSCNQDKKLSSGSQVQKYTCPMHPQIVKDGPGTCPICKMDLVPLHTADSHGAADTSLNSLVKPSNELVISGIKTIRVEKGLKKSEIVLKGIINYNTNNWRSVSARVSGRIEKLYVKYNYERVSKGQKIMEIYSPDLANAQQELLFLKNNNEPALLESAKRKLLLLGLSLTQINRVLSTGRLEDRIAVYSPYSGYVAELGLNTPTSSGMVNQAGGTRISSGSAGGMSSMNATASSATLPEIPDIPAGGSLQIREGQYINAGQKLFDLINTDQVWAEFFARPDQLQEFKPGKRVLVQSIDLADQRSEVAVSLIQPYFSNGINYSLIRANMPNSTKSWKVGQLISVSRDAAIEGNWLPATALVQVGTQYVVFIKKDKGFIPVFVKLKHRADQWIDIGESLEPDTELAINAWFLIDSEGFIKAKRL
ncbi:MAG: efflux RND transporter periplasmic adaptor subunit [Daejeonella sp.]|uniref:efflux RND transporter periplasmic adaptor subunit n=1 Tax=Daejeonella sp. TaxID=2805397 RepID=UPI002732C100|nr:efflux RND transporter periplasmic adaptor subunit [Daejeonella sp.]MDP3468587.1 efflux RND transporter periplasmic adaptor subunit [Daejeonella sp.]